MECNRVLDRYRLLGELNDSELAEIKMNLEIFLRGVTLLEVTDKIIMRASSAFPTIVGSLDAIHLSTALLWNEDNVRKNEHDTCMLLSYDQQLNTAAKACGVRTL